MGKLIPIILLVFGVGAGIGAGILLKPEPKPLLAENPCGDPKASEKTAAKKKDPEPEEGEPALEYVKLNNQFIVPVVAQDKVVSLVVLSLSVEVSSGRREEVFSREPKLRDAFLQVLFDHANMGGFHGAFTSSNKMDILRAALLETATKIADELISDVLIMDINRQDV